MSTSPADFNSKVIDEFRANEGRVGGMFEGMPLLLLHHTGAKSGERRINPVAYQDDDRAVSLAPQVMGAAVRSTRWPDGHLLLHPADPPQLPYSLVTIGAWQQPVAGSWQLPCRVIGWCWGHEGKQPRLFGTVGRGARCYRVPQAMLRRIDFGLAREYNC